MSKSELRVESSSGPHGPEFHFSGNLDENSAPTLPSMGDKATLNLSGLSRMSSSGAEIWLRWIRKDGLQDRSFKVKEIPPCFIRVLNLIPDLIPATWDIESFNVPYVGVANSASENILFFKDKHFTRQELVIPPLVTSPANGKLELDVSPEKYFRFLIDRFPSFKIVEAAF